MGLAILAGWVGLVGLLDLTTLLDLTGLVGLRCQIWLFLGIFWIFNLKNLNLKVIPNESMYFHDPKEFNDPQVFNDSKGISIGSMNFDNPKVYGDTSIFELAFFWPIWAILLRI